MFKCPFAFGLLFVNDLFCVWYVISVSSYFVLVGMLYVRVRE